MDLVRPGGLILGSIPIPIPLVIQLSPLLLSLLGEFLSLSLFFIFYFGRVVAIHQRFVAGSAVDRVR